MSRDREEEEKSPGFKVEDRRRFSETGEARSDVVDRTPEPTPTPESTPLPTSSTPATAHDEHDHQSEELNFSSFIMGLMTQALVHLGEIPDPVSRQTTADLIAARQMIDILGLLQQKTRGNLEKTESDLLDEMLYDLRLRFVERSRR